MISEVCRNIITKRIKDMSQKLIVLPCRRIVSFAVTCHDLYTSQSAFQDKTEGKKPVNKQKGLGGHHQRKHLALYCCLWVINCKGFATKC